MRECSLLVTCFVLFAGSLGAAPRQPERHRAFHVIHYALNLTVRDSNATIGGTAGLRICPIDSSRTLRLDAADMVIHSVGVEVASGETLESGFTLEGEKLTITCGRVLTPADTLAVTIAYTAAPRTGLFFIGPDSTAPDRPRVIWSQGESEENHHWFPCYDYPNDKATCEMRVTVGDQFMAISNGALLNVTRDAARKTRTYFWYSAKPFSSYLISLVVGDYEKLDDTYKAIPVQYYVYPGRARAALGLFSETPSMIKFYSQELGYDYPWPKYAQTVVPEFTYGGMENVSATTLTDRALRDARARLDGSGEALVAHELAHQWFGDLLTCRSWAHAWLNEGFATYLQSLYDEHAYGKDFFQQETLQRKQSVLDADTGIDRRPTVTDRFYESEDVFDGQIYARGACILHMLRFLLGDDLFWKGLSHYVDLHQYGLVTTDDFRQAMEESSGTDLRWFFDEWLTHAGYPRFTVTERYDSLSALVLLTVRQTQQVDSLTPLFRMPVDVKITTSAASIVHRITLEARREQEFSLPSVEAPRNVLFDNGGWLLARIDMDKPVSQWLYQLAHGDVADRECALEGLRPWVDEPDVQAAIGRAILADPFSGVRARGARALGTARDPVVLHLLAPAFHDRSSWVRAAATRALGHFKTLDALVALGTVFGSDSSYAVQAAAVRSLIAIDSAHALSYFDKGMGMNSFNDSIRAAAIEAFGATHSADARTRILELTNPRSGEEVRLAAIAALAADWPADDAVLTRLLALLRDPLQRIRRGALAGLGVIARPEARAQIAEIADHEPNGLLRREARRALDRIARAVPATPSPSYH